jgi:ubiquitin C-terminal hydrolase
MDVQNIGACILFNCVLCINIVDNIPMLRANLYDNPINSVTNKNSVPPISMKSFRLLSISNAGTNMIIVMTASQKDIIAKDM